MKSDSSTSSAGSEGSDSDSKEPTILEDFYPDRKPRLYPGIAPTLRGDRHGLKVIIPSKERTDQVVYLGSLGHPRKGMEKQSHLSRAYSQPKRVFHPRGISPAIQAEESQGRYHILVSDASGLMTSTSTPTKSTPKTLEKPTIIQATLEESIQKRSPPTTSFAEAFLANPSLLPVKEKVSKTLVARYSSRYAELRHITDLGCYYSKTLKVFSAMTEDELSQRSSTPWKTWGIGGNTKFLIARITGSHRIGKECLLSDILETEVPDRYFLSSNQVESLMNGMQESKLHQLFKAQDTPQETTEE